MDYTFDLNMLERQLDTSSDYWISFLEKENFELGVMKLEPGREDIQNPHNSDEVYFIIAGDGYLDIDGTDIAIDPPQALVVPKKLHTSSTVTPHLS